MKYEIPEMIKVGKGAIVNNSSVIGMRASQKNAIYSTAKHGVIGLTKSAAMQCVQQGIRINAICPGVIKTPMIENAFQKEPDEEKRLLEHLPIGRFGEPEEIAEAVLWLCSEKASLLIGAAVAVDGGYFLV